MCLKKFNSNQVTRFDLFFCAIWILNLIMSSGSWSNGHLLFGFLEKMAYIDETGPNKLVALEGRKMWGTLGSSFQLWWPGIVNMKTMCFEPNDQPKITHRKKFFVSRRYVFLIYNSSTLTSPPEEVGPSPSPKTKSLKN